MRQPAQTPVTTNKCRKVALLAACALSLLAHNSLAATRGAISDSPQTASWQSLSRDANAKFGDDEFPGAVAGYKAAIAALEKKNPSSEALLDLYLNLADAYRRNDETQQARRVLKEVAPKILSRTCDDPLLPARYWRRDADVCLNECNGVGYAHAYSNALRIASENLPEEYRAIVKDKLLFLHNLCRMKLYAYAAPVASELQNTRPASLEEEKSIKNGLLEFQQEMTKSASGVPPQQKPNDAKARRLAELAFATKLIAQGQPEKAIAYEKTARELLRSTDPDVLQALENYARENFLQGAARLAKEQSAPRTEQYFRTACEMQPHWPANSGAQRIAQELDNIALYKMNLARVLNNLGKVDEAVTVMDSIPEDALKRQDGSFWHRYGRINSLIAQNQARRGARESASKRFDKVAVIAAKISDPDRAKDLKQHLEKCRRGAR